MGRIVINVDQSVEAEEPVNPPVEDTEVEKEDELKDNPE